MSLREALASYPPELFAKRAWCAAHAATGAPINPLNGEFAKVSDPTTWASFDEACAFAEPRGLRVGFVFSDSDPFTVLDFDNKPHRPLTPEQLARHHAILNACNTFTERSRSGRGYHAICYGYVPHGMDRDSLGVYPRGRFIIFTGDVVNPVPVRNCQDVLDALAQQMQRVAEVGELTQVDSDTPDGDVYERAARASNGAKFLALWAGDWHGLGYRSQSEADHALLDIIAFYTADNAQVRRMFRASALGQRDKAQRDEYLNRSIAQIRAEEPPPIDLDELIRNSAEAVRRAQQPAAVPPPPMPTQALAVPVPPPPPVNAETSPPPGVLGEIARYIYATVPRPVREVATAAALALVAGIAGRAYNVSGTGLNQYLIVVAKTGRGKEGAPIGIDRLLSHAAPLAPVVQQFRGPGAFASGQGLIRALDKQPCFVAVLGEVGLWLQTLTDPRASTHATMLKRALLDVYAKSGRAGVLHSTAYSDTERNTKTINSPAVTLLGDTAPDSFYSTLDASSIADGLLPRFHVLEYVGPRPARNPSAGCAPPEWLAKWIADLATFAVTMAHTANALDVELDDDAQQILDDLDAEADAHINAALSAAESELWNRAHLKALKLAALLAVGKSIHRPKVDAECAAWAVAFVKDGVNLLLRRFQSGDVGNGESKQWQDIRRAVTAFLASSPRELRSYGISANALGAAAVPYHFIRKRVCGLSAFVADRRGPTRALDDMLAAMCNAGELRRLGPLDLQRLGLRSEAKMYGVGDLFNVSDN